MEDGCAESVTRVSVHHLFGGPALDIALPASHARVAHLKEAVHERLGVPTCRQDIVCAHETLHDDAAAPEHVELLVNLHGGCGYECLGCKWYGPCCIREIGEVKVGCTLQ